MTGLKDFYAEYRKGFNPITGEPNLFKDITDQMIWDAAIKSVVPKGFHVVDKKTGAKVEYGADVYFQADGTFWFYASTGEMWSQKNLEVVWEY
jgi:hypothetical protein